MQVKLELTKYFYDFEDHFLNKYSLLVHIFKRFCQKNSCVY